MSNLTVEVDMSKCDKCYECIISCPTDALRLVGGIFKHNPYTCQYCEVCMDVCPVECLKIMED